MHDHAHNHGHTHLPHGHDRAYLVGILLNGFFIAAEIIYGLQANSLALLADAGHNASDVLGLVLAWVGGTLAKRQPTERFTYGLQSASILAALGNGLLLVGAVGGIGWEAVHRFFYSGHETAGITVMIVAAIGVVINGVTAWMFVVGRKEDINIQGVFLHMAGDAAISLGVVLSGGVILMTGWQWLDPLVSCFIAVLIVISSWGLLRDSLFLELHAVPRAIDPNKVKHYFAALPGVAEVHDLHIWAMSTTETALSVHLLTPMGHPGDAFIAQRVKELEKQFHISHATIQLEIGDTGLKCHYAAGHIV